MKRTSLCVLLVLICCYELRAQEQNFSLPNQPLPRPPNLQVDGQGRAFVTAGNQLMRLDSSLVPEQTVNLSSVAVNMSLSSGGDWLVVCTTNLSCAVHDASDLTVVRRTLESVLVATDRVAVFTAGDTFYVGSEYIEDSGLEDGTMRLLQGYGLEGTSGDFARSITYPVTRRNLDREFLTGFSSGGNAYYIATDHDPSEFRFVVFMRVCQATGCPGGSSSCAFTALYEEGIDCGDRAIAFTRDTICGVSVVEDFAGISETSILLSRCREKSPSSNVVCLVRLSELDARMDTLYDQCNDGSTDRLEAAWRENSLDERCPPDPLFTDRCDVDVEVIAVAQRSGPILPRISGPQLINIGANLITTMSASVAIQVDGFSLIMLAYITTPDTGPETYTITMFQVTNVQVTDMAATLTLDNSFSTRQVSSQVRSLQWLSGQEYAIAATDNEILRIPVDDCSTNEDCTSCVDSSNPLCGWCVVENKCSRQSQCQNSNSTISTRWISTSMSSDQCIAFTVTPNQFLVDSPQVLNVSVSGPGLPTKLENEMYSCHLADSEGRFVIIVPAVEVTTSTEYTCNITNNVPNFSGVQAGIHFSFLSSLLNVPFDNSNDALTIYRCGSATQCRDCLPAGSACGWCIISSTCSGLSSDCLNVSNFMQVSGGETFENVCPLLDLSGGTTNYTQHVRVQTDLQLTARNLLAPQGGFDYRCSIGGVEFSAMRVSETSLTCQITQGMVQLSSGSSEITDISIIWSQNPGGMTYTLDVLNSARVTVYDCNRMGSDCSTCVGTRNTATFECGWCRTASSDTCSIDAECTNSQTTPPLLIQGNQCPAQVIMNFSPPSGPPSGGTLITITGTDLGVTIADFDPPDGRITVGGVDCTPQEEGYIQGRSVRCITGAGLAEGEQELVVSLLRTSGIVDESGGNFLVVKPTVSSVDPEFGPIAGGSRLTISGTSLDISSSATITAAGQACMSVTRSPTEITCTTSPASSTMSGMVVIQIDNEMVRNSSVVFSYRNNPNFTSVEPPFTIPAGGITLTFTGEDLDVAQDPQLVINGNPSPCTIVNSTTLTCVTPGFDGDMGSISYTLLLDDAPFPDLLEGALQVSLRPDPSGFELVTESVIVGTTTFIQITGQNFEEVFRDEFNVTVGGSVCFITSFTMAQLLCEAPTDPLLDDQGRAEVIVTVGNNIEESLGLIAYEDSATLPLQVIIPAVAAPVAFILFCCLVSIIGITCITRRTSKKKEQQYTNLIAKMELLEYEMADECKRAFTELQTDLADLVQISSDKNLPYRDFRTFAMRFLFPKAGDNHPVLLPLQVTGLKLEEEKVMKHLDSFKELIMDKKFLLVFVHTLESQPVFSLQDKVTVASLLMVAFQNDLDYATDILQTLLAELMRKTIQKSHPKLLLRRTESIAEKMLANWLAFLLFPYMLDHVGEPLFILYRAIKSQLEKGPVDVVSGEAKNSLSEEKLLRQHMDVKPVEVVVEHEEEEVSLKLWDCDSITQAKEKILDALYRNTPVSKRPQLTGVDIELIGKGANGVTLRDQDATNSKDGEWIKINTLGHYQLHEMSKSHAENPKLPIPRFRLVERSQRPLSGISSGYDTLGTIISNLSAANRSSMAMSASEMNKVYHLVKPEPEDGDGSGQKIMSEVYLTRLLSTKRILQPYVDKLFEAIFAVPHGKVLPKAIKSLFDFLDLQASELGITDSDILHSWKTNSVPLRFWVNVIKNPDFVFDIHKSATVDSCLTVIAQAYIDATSTADIKYTKDTPSARLLYANEVKKYRTDVENYYGAIQSLPKLSNGDMAEYLRETVQVCANSVKQYDPTVVNDPALMSRKLYFVTESALFELYKYASDNSDDIIDTLNEEGLTILAAQFDQVRKALS